MQINVFVLQDMRPPWFSPFPDLSKGKTAY